jgi:hypothetical protein
VLNAVVALSATDAWAVGEANIPVAKGYLSRPLVEHWNGTQWMVVPSPNPGVRVQNVCM